MKKATRFNSQEILRLAHSHLNYLGQYIIVFFDSSEIRVGCSINGPKPPELWRSCFILGARQTGVVCIKKTPVVLWKHCQSACRCATYNDWKISHRLLYCLFVEKCTQQYFKRRCCWTSRIVCKLISYVSFF